MKIPAVIGLVVLLYLPFGAANIYLTEVMHSPTQVSDTEGEWVEIYNDGDQGVDLSTWSLDGKNIGNRTINSKEYFILARELIDGPDADFESFESYWGNSNGIWDEPFNATEVSMSLKEEDTIILTNGLQTDTFTYNKSFGGKNGKTIERLSLTQWQEGPVGGTPSYGNFSTNKNTGNQIMLYVNILNSLPKIEQFNMTDDSEEEGIQIYPLVNGEKEIQIQILVNDSDGVQDIQQVFFSQGNVSRNMPLYKNVSSTAAWYKGNITFGQIPAGEYTIILGVRDKENLTTINQSFRYEGILSIELNVSSFTLNMKSGTTETRAVQIVNTGNVPVQTEVSAEDLISENGIIPKNAIAIFQDVWIPLENAVYLNASVMPQTTKEIQVRIQIPQQAKSGNYKGKMTFTSVGSKK